MSPQRISKVTWKNVSTQIKKINPKLAAIINSLNVNATYPLYKISYSYGDLILKNGIFQIPDENGQTIPISSSEIPSFLKEDLGYASGKLPIGIVAKNATELYINTKNSILPVLVTKPGSILGLWKEFESAKFHPDKIFNITAGARFIFMLPNISDLSLHKNLKRDFQLKLGPPKHLRDQWEIFKFLCAHPLANNSWQVELIFFSKKWFDHIKEREWQPLYQYFLEEAWNSCEYERNRMFYDFMISCAQVNRNLKPNPYLTDTLKHLLMISIGTGVGFSVASDENLAPIRLLQKIYLESYGLKKYAPIIFQPMHFSSISQPTYYSLSFPTTLAFSPKSRKISSTLHELLELKHILNVFFDEIKKGKLNIEDTFIGKIVNSLNFDFFHSKPDRLKEILLTQNIPKGDLTISESLAGFNREFSESGMFIRGCVRISNKDIM